MFKLTVDKKNSQKKKTKTLLYPFYKLQIFINQINKKIYYIFYNISLYHYLVANSYEFFFDIVIPILYVHMYMITVYLNNNEDAYDYDQV